MKNEALNIHNRNSTLETVDTMKYLGINLDKHLTFEAHTDELTKEQGFFETSDHLIMTCLKKA